MKNFIFEKCENAPVQAIGGRAGSGGGGGWVVWGGGEVYKLDESVEEVS